MEKEVRAHDEDGFGALLRKLRLARGLTQEELAERAGLSARGLSDLERGARQRPRPESFALLAEALDLDPAERAGLDRALHLCPPRRPRGVTSVPTSTNRDESRCSPSRHNRPAAATSFVGRER